MLIIPRVNKIIPEKKEIVIIILAVPGTAILVNFMYSAYKIKQTENNNVRKPNIIPAYNGFKEYAVTPLINSVTGPADKRGNFASPLPLGSLTYLTKLCLKPTQTDRPLMYGLNSF